MSEPKKLEGDILAGMGAWSWRPTTPAPTNLDELSSTSTYVAAPETEEAATTTDTTDSDLEQTEEMNGAGLSRAPVTASPAQAARVLGPNAHLWDDPRGADVVIFCKNSVWEVHRHILVGKSEWMEKWLPPVPEDGGVARWRLDNWDEGQLSTILRYMYMENYEGGDYDSKKPLNGLPIVNAVAHFMAGSACLCRSLMDHSLTQLEAAARGVKDMADHIRNAHIDEFEQCLRRALIIMYNEPDQWRIRALRMVMGKLMNVCFPIVLQHPRWETAYQYVWGNLRLRVIADHKWLLSSGTVEQNHVILEGFQSMKFLWVKYRPDDWVPTDDLMFPERATESAHAPSPPPSPTPASSTKRKSKAIPIMRPDGTPALPLSLLRLEDQTTDQVQAMPQYAHSQNKGKRKSKSQEIEETQSSDKGKAPTYAPMQSVNTVPYSTAVNSHMGARGPPQFISQNMHIQNNPFNPAGAMPYPRGILPNLAGSSNWQQQQQSHMGCPPRFPIYDASRAVHSCPCSPERVPPSSSATKQQLFTPPFLPGGPSFFAETSTGEPSDGMSCNSGPTMSKTLFGEPSVGPAPLGTLIEGVEEMTVGDDEPAMTTGDSRNTATDASKAPSAVAKSDAGAGSSKTKKKGRGKKKKN